MRVSCGMKGFPSAAVAMIAVGLVLPAIAATGCGGAARRSARPAFEVSDRSSVVVMGVSPSMRLRAYQGWNGSGSWERNGHATPFINELPGDGGYVVARIPPSAPGEAYGILRVLPSATKALTVCTDGSAAVFEVPKNAVVYVGDFTLTFDGSYGVEVARDFGKAAAFVKESYPELAGRLVEGRARIARVTNGLCDGAPVSFIAK